MEPMVKRIIRRMLGPVAALGVLGFGLLAAPMVLAPLAVQAQLIPGLPGASQQPEEPEWIAPDITELPADWYAGFAVDDPAKLEQRFQAFVAGIRAHIDGLEGPERQTAELALANLVSLRELLDFATRDSADAAFEPVLTLEQYTLDELLRLHAARRDLDAQHRQGKLEMETAQRQIQVLENRREQLWRRYQGFAVESPKRVQLGIELAAARVELALTRERVANLEARSAALLERQQVLQEQEDFALSHLAAGEVSLESVQQDVEQARAAVTEASQQVTSLQSELLKVMSAQPPNASLLLLRKQQLTRATALQSLRQLQAALATTRRDWWQLQSGELDLGYDFRTAASEARKLSDQALREVDVWSSQTQATLVAPLPGDSANALANYDLAQSVARETLDIIDRIRAVSDDLLLTEEILAGELVSAQSGLRKAWSSLLLQLGSLWDGLVSVADYQLFSISDRPVTPGGIFTMVFIVALAYAISWLLRYLIAHAAGKGNSFSQSPAAYTLGRILHYIIITVGLFAAFTSIGFDFTSFALIAGALSVGIGFGLQAVVNNFVSGLILLLEGSLRVGDYIELGGQRNLSGVVREINTRATVVNTNDNVDVVVPNSELVTTRLTNWTLRESIARMRIPFGVAYGTDKEKVREVALAAAGDVEFALTHMPDRQPQVRLYNFGDSALEFDMLLWVSRAGVRRPHRVRCDFLWHLETRLTEAGIEIPFPQRDIHLRSDARPSGLEPGPPGEAGAG